jgi:tetratricopeptide (TPR) repeat protein
VSYRALPFLLLLIAASPAYAQTKDAFVDALISLVTALDGETGTEGPAVLDALRAMEAGLGHWDGAIAAAEAGMAAQIAAAPQEASARMRTALGLMYLERGRFTEAAKQLDAAAAATTSRGVDLFRAWTHAAAGRSAESSQALRRAFERDPSNPLLASLVLHDSRTRSQPADVVSRAIAGVHAAEPALDAAGPRRFLSPALLDDAGAAVPLFALSAYADGYQLLSQARFAEAIQQLRAAAERDPLVRRTPSEAHRVLGMSAWKAGQLPKSIEQFEEAIRLEPLDERSRMALADVLVAAGMPLAAERVLLDAVRVLPRAGQAHWRLGRLYRTLQRDGEAVQPLETAAATRPLAGAGALHRLIGQLRENHFDSSRAIQSFAQAIDINQNDALAHRELAEALQGIDRFDEARAEFVTTLLIDPTDAVAWTGLGQIHAAAGRLDRALAALRKAVAIDGRSPEARYALARTLIRAGQRDEGARELQVFEQLQREAMAEQRRRVEESVK